jgi:hypothetical protein
LCYISKKEEKKNETDENDVRQLTSIGAINNLAGI